MQSSVIGSLVTQAVRGQTTSSTTANFVVADSRPTTTRPTPSATRTIIDVSGRQYKDRVTLKVTPFGGDANNDIVNLKVQGWHSLQSQTGLPSTLYIPHAICEVAATLSSSLPGIAAMGVVATEFFADSLALTAGTGTGIAVLHTGAADIDVAWFECDVSSFEYVEITYSLGSGGDRVNCLYRF